MGRLFRIVGFQESNPPPPFSPSSPILFWDWYNPSLTTAGESERDGRRQMVHNHQTGNFQATSGHLLYYRLPVWKFPFTDRHKQRQITKFLETPLTPQPTVWDSNFRMYLFVINLCTRILFHFSLKHRCHQPP